MEVGSSGLVPTLGLAFSLVGALIASRHPDNAMGWLFVGVGVATGLEALAGSYAQRYVESKGGSQALGEAAAVYGNVSWIPFILVPCAFVLLLFPDGRLLSPRWRWAAWCSGLGIVGFFLVSVVAPGAIEDFPQIENPYGIDSPLVGAVTAISVVLLLAGMVGSAASLIARFRHAQGERRKQIK